MGWYLLVMMTNYTIRMNIGSLGLVSTITIATRAHDHSEVLTMLKSVDVGKIL